MKRIARTILMVAIACSGTVAGFGGCLFQEARDSCVVDLLDWNLTGDCVIDVDFSEFDGDDDN